MQDTGGAIGFEQGASEKSQCLVRRIRHDHKRMLVVAFDPVHQRLAPFLDCFIEEQGRQLWRSRFRPAPPAFGNGNNTVQASAQFAGEPELGCCRAFKSEEHTSELQSLMRISYAVFCLKKK